MVLYTLICANSSQRNFYKPLEGLENTFIDLNKLCHWERGDISDIQRDLTALENHFFFQSSS